MVKKCLLLHVGHSKWDLVGLGRFVFLLNSMRARSEFAGLSIEAGLIVTWRYLQLDPIYYDVGSSMIHWRERIDTLINQTSINLYETKLFNTLCQWVQNNQFKNPTTQFSHADKIRVNRNSKDKKAILLMDFFVSFKIHTNKKVAGLHNRYPAYFRQHHLTNQSKVFIMNSVIHM